MKVVIGSSIIVMRNIPYPLSFSRTAASTMDPAMGASTWALGNQRCRPYSGIFSINVIIHGSQISILDQELFIGFAQYCSSKLRVLIIF